MTKKELIKIMKDEITVSSALSYSIPDSEFERIISMALRWFYINYKFAVETKYFIIKRDVFKNEVFRRTRSIKMPDCVVSVYEVKEIKNTSKLGYFGADFSGEKMIAQEIYLSPFNADDVVLRTAYESYWDLSQAFFLERIGYDYNHNTNKVTILGRDPGCNVCMTCYVKIPQEALFEDWTFQKYCCAQAKISLGRILGMFTYQLPGGVTINADSMKSEGQEELQQILESIDQENVPDWFLVYHG